MRREDPWSPGIWGYIERLCLKKWRRGIGGGKKEIGGGKGGGRKSCFLKWWFLVFFFFLSPLGKKKTEISEKESKGKDDILRYIHQSSHINRNKNTKLYRLHDLKTVDENEDTDFIAHIIIIVHHAKHIGIAFLLNI